MLHKRVVFEQTRRGLFDNRVMSDLANALLLFISTNFDRAFVTYIYRLHFGLRRTNLRKNVWMTSTNWNPFIHSLTLLIVLTSLTFLTLWNDTTIRLQQLFQVIIGKCIWRSFSVGALHFIHKRSTLSDKPRRDVPVVRLAFILLRYWTNDAPRLSCLHDLLANLFRLLLVDLDRFKFELFQYKAVLRTDTRPLVLIILRHSRTLLKAA
jgi:hypothetical protein